MSAQGISVRRYLMAFAFAAVATTGLLMLMEQLIRADQVAIADPQPPYIFDIDPRIPDEDPDVKKDIPKPPPKVSPPPLVNLVHTTDLGPSEIGVFIGGPNFGGPTSLPNTGLADGGLMSLAQVAPEYPARAKARGIEGYVVVQFTVNANGAVENIHVIDAKPAGVFDRAAINAVRRSKYRPQVENGRAKAVPGVRKQLTFTLNS